ncbi:ATP-binding protein [Azospirillum thermophilum]|uniref:histidine kinase n=1 Tax=Azospirillum thermophilum TaxID=2202148 RepID=A0A2S2CKH3_9PROT|nr:ATP-binding protein [Azospirillum thermophilum]AWK84929.1 histidine kinase [Azospirillum thermophilum]
MAWLPGLALAVCIVAGAAPLGAEGDGAVRGGVLDLRGGVPKERALALDGEWLVSWGRLAGAETGLGPGAVAMPPPRPDGWTTARLPGVWNGQPRPDGTAMGSVGVATYRLFILLPEDGVAYTVQVPLVKSASRVWLNGSPVAAAGRPAMIASAETAQTATRFVTLPAGEAAGEGARVADLAIEVSNHFHHEGGIGSSPRLAAGDFLQRAWTLRQLVSAGVVLSLFLLAAYVAAFARRGERSAYYLMTGLLAASAVRMLCTSELLTTVFPAVDASLAYRLEYLPIYLFWPIYFHALDHLLPGCLNRRVGRAMDLLGGAGVLFVLVADPMVFTRFRDVASALLGLSILYFIARIAAAARQRRYGAWVLGVGAVLFMASVVHDAMMYAHLFDSVDLAPFGELAFLFMHALVLGRRVMRAFDDVRNLSTELAALNEGLERQVQDRTEALRRQSAIVESVLREAKERAEDDAAVKTRFLAHLSHEVRTPLNAVLGMVRLMQRDSLSAGQADRLRVIDGAGRQLVALLDEVLELSRLEAGRVMLALEPNDVPGLVRDAVALCRPSAADKGLDVTLTIGKAVGCWYLVDGRRLHQILLNLLSNAIKFTPRGSISVTLDLGAEAAPQGEGHRRLVLSVADSGPGVPDAAKATIFDAFTRLESAGLAKGSGLGLAIARGLVEALGGTIRVADRPGGGALFTVELPVTAAGEPAAPAREAVPEVPALDILMVEDAPENRAVLRAFLAAGGHRVTETDRAEEAVRLLLARRRFDVILMDIRLAGMSGLEAARRIRALPDEAAALTPIIAVTANVSSADEVDYRAAGIDDLLPKPLDPDRLAAALARFAPAGPAAALRASSTGRQAPRLAETIALDRLGALLDLFAATCREQRAALAAADRAGDGAWLAAIAHRLKGSAATYGFPALANAAASLDRAVRSDGPAGAPLADRVRAVDAELRAVLEALDARRRAPADG